jgi:hypothetical protein
VQVLFTLAVTSHPVQISVKVVGPERESVIMVESLVYKVETMQSLTVGVEHS